MTSVTHPVVEANVDETILVGDTATINKTSGTAFKEAKVALRASRITATKDVYENRCPL
jgi:hypothetical protein